MQTPHSGHTRAHRICPGSGPSISCEILYSIRQTVTGEVRGSRSGQLLKQRLRLDKVTRFEALGEPGVNGRQQGTGLGALALAVPEPRQARRGAQLEGLRLLGARD